MNNNFFSFPSITEPLISDIHRSGSDVETFYPLTIIDPCGNILNYQMKKCCKKYKKGKRCKKCPNE